MKVKTKKRCPKCTSELKYNRTNLKRYLKNERIMCKKCGHPLSKQISDEILNQLDKKSVINRLTS